MQTALKEPILAMVNISTRRDSYRTKRKATALLAFGALLMRQLSPSEEGAENAALRHASMRPCVACFCSCVGSDYCPSGTFKVAAPGSGYISPGDANSKTTLKCPAGFYCSFDTKHMFGLVGRAYWSGPLCRDLSACCLQVSGRKQLPHGNLCEHSGDSLLHRRGESPFADPQLPRGQLVRVRLGDRALDCDTVLP